MWQLDSQQRSANLDTSYIAARIAVDQPDLGIAQLRWQQHDLGSARLLRVMLCSTPERSALTDCYVRGRDVVTTFGDAASPPQVRPQIYWRLITDHQPASCGLELVLSIETDLLDSDPHARVESTLPGREAMVRTSSGWQTLQHGELHLRPADAEPLVVIRSPHWSYAEMVYPSDFTGSTIRDGSDQWHISWDLFPEHLEKGVIRRARVRGVFFSDVRDDLDRALQAFESFKNSPLPLTT